MLTLAAHSTRDAAVASARRHAVTHPGLRIVVVYDVVREPWPFRVIAHAADVKVEWPDGISQTYAAPVQLALDQRGKRAA